MKNTVINFVFGIVGSIVATLIINHANSLYGYFIQYVQILNFVGICTLICLIFWLISKSNFDR